MLKKTISLKELVSPHISQILPHNVPYYWTTRFKRQNFITEAHFEVRRSSNHNYKKIPGIFSKKKSSNFLNEIVMALL